MKNKWVMVAALALTSGAYAAPKFNSISLTNVCRSSVKVSKVLVKYDKGQEQSFGEIGGESQFLANPGYVLRFYLEHDSIQSVEVTSSAQNVSCFQRRSYNIETGAVHPVIGYRYHCGRGAKVAVYLSASRMSAEVWENGKPAPFGQLDCMPPARPAKAAAVGDTLLHCYNTQVADAGYVVTFTQGWLRPRAHIETIGAIGTDKVGDHVCRLF